MIFKKNTLWTEPDDQCTTCTRLNDCPLADALNQGVVQMSYESFGVKHCRMYEAEDKPQLRILS